MDSERQPNWKPKSGVDLAIFFLILIVVLLIGWGVHEQQHSTVGAAIGALGTLILAYATVQSVRQNQQSIEKQGELVEKQAQQVSELRKQRQQGMANVAVRELLDPAISALESNLNRLKSGDIGWTVTDCPEQDLSLSNPDTTQDVEASVVRWAADHDTTGVIEKIQDYQEETAGLKRIGRQLEDELREDIGPVANGLDSWLENKPDDKRDVEYLVELVMNQKEEENRGLMRPELTLIDTKSSKSRGFTNRPPPSAEEYLEEIEELEDHTQELIRKLEAFKEELQVEYMISGT